MGPAVAALVLLLAPRVAAPAASAETGGRTPAPLRAMTLYLQGLFEASRSELEPAYQAFYHAYLIEPRSPAIVLHLASANLHMGDLDRAAELAAEGLALDSTHARLHALHATALAAAGRAEEALRSLELAATYDTTDVDQALALAREYERRDRIDDARRMYERVLEGSDPQPETLLRYATVLGRLGRFVEALPLLDEAARGDADLPALPLTQAWVLDGLDRHAEAVPAYLEQLRLHPEDRTVRRRLVNGLMALNRDEEALAHARRLYEEEPGLASGRVLAGIQLRLRRPEAAREVARELRRRAPGDLETAEFAVLLSLRTGDRDGAIAEARRLTEEAPDAYRSWLLRARAEGAARRSEEEIAALTRAEGLAPDSSEAHLALGRAWFTAGRYARAESVFVGALGLGADTAAVWYEVASTRERRKDFDGAEEAIRMVLERRPENPQALNFLGYLYADYNRNLEESVRLIRKALAIDGENGFIMDSLGWAYYRLGELDSARTVLERAVAASGEDPTILEHLGDVYSALKRHDVARAKYERALELGPEDPAALERKLRTLP